MLVWGHTGAVSMLVSLAGQRVLSCHRATILRVAQQQLRRQYERESSGRELAFRWKGRGLASTMSTTSRPVSASLEDCVEGSQRFVDQTAAWVLWVDVSRPHHGPVPCVIQQYTLYVALYNTVSKGAPGVPYTCTRHTAVELSCSSSLLFVADMIRNRVTEKVGL